MARQEDLLEKLEETVFALMMEEVVRVEGKKALEENERLKADESFVVPEETYRKGLCTIKRHFSKNTRRTTMRTVSKLISRVAVIVLILLLLFTTAFATIPEFRAKTMNLITEVFDDRTRIEFGVVEKRTSVSESESESDVLVGWVPEGFELVDKGETDRVFWEKYSNDKGAIIEVDIYLGVGRACEVDTEDAIVEYVTVNGYQSMLILKDNFVQVVYSRVEREEIYYVRGRNINSDTILRIAENINID